MSTENTTKRVLPGKDIKPAEPVKPVDPTPPVPPASERAAPALPRTLPPGRWLVSAMLIVFGICLWALGAKYSLEGWIIALNWLLALLELPLVIPQPVGWNNLWLIPLGLAYSYIELFVRPVDYVRMVMANLKSRRIPMNGTHVRGILAIFLLWALTHGTDNGSTILALASAGEDAPVMAQWIASSPILTIGLSIVLTYAPEMMILKAIHMVISDEE